MTSKQDVQDALTEVDQQLAGLRPRIVSAAERPLLEGDWTVWDALCHLAGRSNSVAMIQTRLERARTQGEEQRRDVTRNIDEINQGQIDDRQGQSAEELLDEITAGHEASRKLLDEIDQELLTAEFPSFRGDGNVPGAQLILQASAGHDRMHLQQIRGALGN